MSAALLETPAKSAADAEPFRIGYRYIHTVLPDGTKRSVEVPLTEEDFLHPQEGDVFVVPSQHTLAVIALYVAIEVGIRYRNTYTRIFADHRVDWQKDDVRPHGPDLVVFDDFFREWDPSRGTLPVEDLGASALVVFEVTSESTRHVDLGKKFDEYEKVGIPYYFVLDLAAPDGQPRLLAFRNRRGGGFEEMVEDPGLGHIVPRLGLWFRLENGRIVVADEMRRDILEPVELAKSHDRLTDLTKKIESRAEAEKQRAEAEKQRAEAAELRADELTRELAALKARLESAPQPN